MSRDFIVQAQVIKREAPFVQVGSVVTIVGKDGSLIYTAEGVPSNSLGVYTDLYIDTVAPNNFYQKNVSNVWVLKGSLKGISGDDGREVLIQNNGTYIQWQYEGDTEWTNIVELSTLKGDTGSNIELNKSATHIQWRVVGDANWIDLVALVDLKGDAGYTPQKGVDYFDGRGIVSFELIDTQEKTKTYRMLFTDATYVDIPIIDGNDGVDGLTPYIGINGNWWIGDVDQNIKAAGVDGISPTIGLNGNWYLGAVDTGVKAQGQDGYTPIKGVDYFDGYTPVKDVDYFDGITPTIGENKHWFIGAIDTGIVAEGIDGVTPTITIGENENWYINGVDSGKPSRGANATSAYDIYLAGGGTLSEAEFNASITNIPSHIADTTIHHTIDDLDVLYEPKNSNIQEHIADTDIHVTTTDKSNWDEKADLDEVLKLDQTTPQTLTSSPKINDLLAGKMCYVDANKQLKPIDVFWDNVNKRMGISTNNPSSALHISSPAFPVQIIERTTGPQVSIYAADRTVRSNSSGLLNGAGVAKYFALSDNLGNLQHAGSFGVKWINSTTKTMQMFFNAADNGVDPTTGTEKMTINGTGEVGIGTTLPKSKLQVVGGIQCGDDTAAASADKLGTRRRRTGVNGNIGFYVSEECSQKGVDEYEWTEIFRNEWIIP